MERSEAPRMPARVICVICHERKVRCDLQVSRDKICSNCRRLNQPCVQRQGRRIRNRAVGTTGDSIRRGDSMRATSGQGMVSPVDSSHPGEQNTPESKSFIASDSVLYEETPPNNPCPLSWQDWKSTEQQLRNRYINIPFVSLDEPLRLALLDSFAEHLGHVYPFVNMTQLRETPPFLQKALVLAGSLVRRIDTVEHLQVPYALYQQSKDAIYTSSGGDTIPLLMAITITTCWKPITGAIVDTRLLFPFPASFSPNIDLLNHHIEGNDTRRNGAMDFLAFESSLIDWSADGSFYGSDFP